MSPAEHRGRAPDRFRVRLVTSRGDVVIEVRRAWAPRGADRLHRLVAEGHFDGARFFRVVEGFVAQFGISGDPARTRAWRGRAIEDDPVVASNVRGAVAFAAAGPDSRTTQLFVNLRDNAGLDRMGFAPVGEVVEGMDAVDRLHAGYGEGPPRGRGPSQARIAAEGEAYLAREFPALDRIVRATLEPVSGPA